jgi:hypothetical protein
MKAERMPPHNSALVALELPGEPVDDETGPALSPQKRMVDRWPVAAIIVGILASLAWVAGLLWFAVQLIF